MTHLHRILIAAALLLCAAEASAQHTFGVTGGYGMSTVRLKPAEETRPVWNRCNAGLTWRYYGPQRFVGGFGLDLEYLQQGFSYAPYASTIEDKKDYRYYTRRYNSLVLPVVWAPHFYIRHRVRIFLEAMATFKFH